MGMLIEKITATQAGDNEWALTIHEDDEKRQAGFTLRQQAPGKWVTHCDHAESDDDVLYRGQYVVKADTAAGAADRLCNAMNAKMEDGFNLSNRRMSVLVRLQLQTLRNLAGSCEVREGYIKGLAGAVGELLALDIDNEGHDDFWEAFKADAQKSHDGTVTNADNVLLHELLTKLQGITIKVTTKEGEQT